MEVEREREKMLQKLMIERVTQGWWEVPVGSWGAWLAGASYNKETNHKKFCTRLFLTKLWRRDFGPLLLQFLHKILAKDTKIFLLLIQVGMNLSSFDYDLGTTYF